MKSEWSVEDQFKKEVDTKRGLFSSETIMPECN